MAKDLSYLGGRKKHKKPDLRHKKHIIMIGNHGHEANIKLATHNGRKVVYCPSHPNANGSGYITRHRLVMEQELKRYLREDEVVHHIDGDFTNDSLDNLEVFETTGQHTKYHTEERNWNWVRARRKTRDERNQDIMNSLKEDFVNKCKRQEVTEKLKAELRIV